jgi:tRNA U34 5-methylaminomethyl-2-thiouridine-forming methyltransferase MnmC
VTDAAAWTPVLTADGSLTLAHPLHGQTCHSRAGAWTEARERYAAACRIRERALELATAGCGRLHVLDVGTGLGLNIAAALEALAGTGVALDVVSLEIDAGVIAATLALGPVPLAELEREHVLVRSALAQALSAPSGERVTLATGSLRLLLGDGRETIRALERRPLFDAVFLDPFSPGVARELWEPDFLAEVAARMAPRSLLSTYTVSLGVRAALRAAGLRVGVGPRVGTKAAGTLASPDRDLTPPDTRTERRIEARASRGRARAHDFPPENGLH